MNRLTAFFDLGFTADNAVPPENPPEDASGESSEQDHRGAMQGLAVGGGLGTAGAAASWQSGLFALIAFGIALIVLAGLLAWWRKRRNPTYWQVACWALVTTGILVRQLFLPSDRLDLSGFSLSLALASGFVSLAVLPLLMRWLNRMSSGPNVEQVAVPFALGSFWTMPRSWH